MNPLALTDKRVLLTQANDFMGPVLNEVFSELGATLIADDARNSRRCIVRTLIDQGSD